MAVLADTRKTFLQTFNEVRRKLGLNDVSTLDQDTQSRAMIDFTNDVLAEISDFGDWQEMYKEEVFALLR